MPDNRSLLPDNRSLLPDDRSLLTLGRDPAPALPQRSSPGVCFIGLVYPLCFICVYTSVFLCVFTVFPMCAYFGGSSVFYMLWWLCSILCDIGTLYVCLYICCMCVYVYIVYV